MNNIMKKTKRKHESASFSTYKYIIFQKYWKARNSDAYEAKAY